MAPPNNTQPIEIPWTLLATTRSPSNESLSTDPPSGPTLSIFTWTPETTPETLPHKGKRIIYYKFTVTFVPFFLTFLAPETAAFDLTFKHFSFPTRIGVLTLRLTASEGAAYFADAVPRKRTIQEEGFGNFKTSSQGSSSLSVGKSNSTLHDSTTTSVTTTTDPGVSWGVDLGIVGFGGTTDTEQTTGTTVTRDASQNLDVTQRDASNERSELFNFTTRLSNTLSVLDAGHLGSSDLQFTLWAPPIASLPNVLPNNPEQSYIDAMRWRSSGITGVQDFFAAAIADEDAKVCLEANLDSVHVAMPPHPAPPDLTKEPDTAAVDQVLDYLYKKYPAGFPIDDLDVDLSDTAEVVSATASKSTSTSVLNPLKFILAAFSTGGEKPPQYEDVRRASVYLWAHLKDAYYHQVAVVGHGILAKGHLQSCEFVSFYKPFRSVWLEAVTDEYHQSLALDFETAVPFVFTKNLKACLSPGITSVPSTEVQSSSSNYLLDMEFGQIPPGANFKYASAMIDQSLAAKAASDNHAARRTVTLTEPKIRNLIIKTAANTKSDIDLRRAAVLGFPQRTIESARQAGITTLGQFAAHLYEQQTTGLNEERMTRTRGFIKRFERDKKKRFEMTGRMEQPLVKIDVDSSLLPKIRRSPVPNPRGRRG